MTKVKYDEALIEEIAARFDLRKPNENALRAVVKKLAEAEGKFIEAVADLATGVGKTFLMSSLIEYLAVQGVRHVLVVTPGSTIQRKTLANFDAASDKFVAGADFDPTIITPDNFRAAAIGAVMRDPMRLKVFVFNVQQLIQPTDKVSRKTRAQDENLGEALYKRLEDCDDLVVISDEHHVYHEKARAFSGAIRDLNPLALVGLTATPDKADYDKIVFQYTLGEAIADGHVKVPVIVYRKDGTKDWRTQLSDACTLLRHKEQSYDAYRDATPGTADVKPALFVVCQSIAQASEAGQILAGDGLIGDPKAVLEITSQSSDEALQALADVEKPNSPIRAIVSVNMLREGWDVKNIAVIVALRRLASQTLTEQILGRGLRLPFGRRTDMADVDQVDLVAHDSYRELLDQKDVLKQRIQLPATAVEVDETGAATTAEFDPSAEQQRVTPTSEDGDTGQDFGKATLPLPIPGVPSLFDVFEEGDSSEPGTGPLLGFQETEDRQEAPIPQAMSRVEGAPQVIFPRRESRLAYAPFSLSQIPDGDARQAGARFIEEVPTFIFRDAIEAKRGASGEVQMFSTPQDEAEVRQPLAAIDVVQGDLTNAIMQFPEVPSERASKNAAKRLVRAFLAGAGVSSQEASAEWGEKRRLQAVEGMKELIRKAIGNRRQEVRFDLVPVTLPIEPIMVDPGTVRDAYNDEFAKRIAFKGWRKSILPIASLDAKTTEWEIAHLLDRDPGIEWWLRVYVGGPAFIPTTDGAYFPDFIAVDKAGNKWLIEGKSDKNANDADVLRKREAAENWARAVCDEEDYGNWRYVFATESHIKQAAGSWNGLLVAANPD